MASDHIHIPEGLLSNILQRLSVKSVIRFQSVSKSWISLISSPFFSKTHHSFHSAAADEPPIHLRQRDGNRCMLGREKLVFPVESPHYHADLLDVIHGVLVFTTYYHATSSSPLKSIVFWNPRVRRHVSAPLPPGNHHLLGAGFDASNNDFKAVWVPNARPKSRYYKVFSARAGDWEQKEWTLPYFVMKKPRYGCFFNKAFYWITNIEDKEDYELVYFEWESEKFGRMELPREIQDVHRSPRVFVNNGGLLSIEVKEMVTNLGHVLFQSKLWTMKKCGVWNKDPMLRFDVKRLLYDRDNGLIERYTYVFKESMFLHDIR